MKRKVDVDADIYRPSKRTNFTSSTFVRRSVRLSNRSVLRLPRELRDLVYDQLWKMNPRILLLDLQGKDYVEIHYRNYVEIHYRKLERPLVQGLSKWLLTNKSVLSEALSQLHRYATCAHGDPFHWIDRQVLQKFGPYNILLDIRALSQLMVTAECMPQRLPRPPALTVYVDRKALEMVDSTLQDNLRVLDLELTFRHYDYISGDGWSMGLPIAETVDLRLEELNVYINFTFDFSKNDRNSTVDEKRHEYATLLAVSQPEVLRVSKFLFGVDTAVKMEIRETFPAQICIQVRKLQD